MLPLQPKKMKHLKVTTTTTSSTEVTIGGRNVEDVLTELCGIAHDALISLSIYRQEHNLPDDEFDTIEGPLCKLLDLMDN